MGQELEYKYRLPDQAEYRKLCQALQARFPGGWESVTMETDCYDTRSRQLAQRRWTLGIRNENGASVLCLKIPGAGLARQEWEVPEGVLPGGLVALVRQGAPESLLTLTGLRPVCGARFVRLRRMVPLSGAAVELALDRGVLLGSTKELPFWELEAELKSGDSQILDQWCQTLATKFSLTPEPASKFARAYALMGGNHA